MRRAVLLIADVLLAGPAQAAPLTLKAQPARLKDNAALPRIAAPDAAGARINAALAKVDAQWRAFNTACTGESPGNTSTGHHVETTLAGAGYLSLQALAQAGVSPALRQSIR